MSLCKSVQRPSPVHRNTNLRLDYHLIEKELFVLTVVEGDVGLARLREVDVINSAEIWSNH